MAGNELLHITMRRLVQSIVFVAMEQQVIAHTAPDKTFLDPWQAIHSRIQLQEGGVVGIQVLADRRSDAGGLLALGTDAAVPSLHAIHVG